MSGRKGKPMPTYEEFYDLQNQLNQSQLDLEQANTEIENIYGALEWEWNWPVTEINRLVKVSESKEYTGLLEKANKDIQILLEAIDDAVIDIDAGGFHHLANYRRLKELANKYKDK